VSYWKGRRLVFHNYFTSVQVTGPPVVAEVLHFFDTWRSAEELVAAAPHAARLLDQLAEQTLLERWDGQGAPPAALETPWRDWEPEAGLFHFSTKNHFDTDEDLEETERAIQARATEATWAPPARRLPADASFPLRRPTGPNPLEAVLARRRTWREFGSKPLSRAIVARLLWWVWGVRRWLIGEATRHALRSSPSAGARQVLEVYLVAVRVAGLEPGFYHYEKDGHRLTRLPGRVTGRTLPRFLPRQWWFHDAAALFVMSAVFHRVQSRYPAPRHYRSVLLEAGHFCQTFCLAAAALGLAPFSTQALADRAVEEALGIDGVEESVIYAGGVGHRPPGGAWRPWPDHEPGHPYRAPAPRRGR
jgi:SagB-type dehydrogenase family enzyme